MYINSRFTDFYDWSSACTFDKNDTRYNRTFREYITDTMAPCSYGFVLMVGFRSIIVSEVDRNPFGADRALCDKLNLKYNTDARHLSDHFSVCMDTKDYMPISDRHGKLVLSQAMFDYVCDSEYFDVTVVDDNSEYRDQHGVYDPVVFVDLRGHYGAKGLMAYGNISIQNTKLTDFVLKYFTVDEVGGFIDNYLSQVTTAVDDNSTNDEKIVYNGFDRTVSFRHRK